MNQNICTITLSSCLLLLLAGCSTPKGVLDLSDKTAGNVVLLNKYVSSFEDQQQNLASQRIAISADQSEAFAELAARCQSRMDAMRLAGMTGQFTLITNIIAISDSEAATLNQLTLVSSNETQILLRTQDQLQNYSKNLSSLSSSLSQLAKDDSLETRVENLITFAQAVQTDVANANAASTNASQLMAKRASGMTNSIPSVDSLLKKINSP